MSLLDRLFGRKSPPPPPELDVAVLEAHLAAAVARTAGRPAEPDLLRARFADGCRDAGLRPLLPHEFDRLTEGLDDEAWGRLALLVGTLDLAEVRAALAVPAAAKSLLDLADVAFFRLARETTLLTAEVLRQGPLRVEELARRFVAALGATVRDETAQASAERLRRLDYGRLLAEAERARQAAADRVERLRRLQDEQEARRPRRGKW
jgi:hypothetical protein